MGTISTDGKESTAANTGNDSIVVEFTATLRAVCVDSRADNAKRQKVTLANKEEKIANLLCGFLGYLLRGSLCNGLFPSTAGVLSNAAQSPPREEGWMRGQENVAKHPCFAQTGWSNMTATRIPKH